MCGQRAGSGADAVALTKFAHLQLFYVNTPGKVDVKELEEIILRALDESAYLGAWAGPNPDYESVVDRALGEIANVLRGAGLSEAAVSKVVEEVRCDMYRQAFNCAVDGYQSGIGVADCSYAAKELADKIKSAVSEAVKAQSVGPRLKV